ncbi:hypothetical protein F5Y08DRAFT_301203 [Xylaria arbuscula]|nr:hypothetical protein F5Y08DRAFT_301203 [Xylaria arbuscula]
MRFFFSSLSAIAVPLLLASSGPLSLAPLVSAANANANANAEPKPDTTPDTAPTKTTATVKARETTSTPNLLSALYQLATEFDLRACIPAALPLVTTLPKIPGELLRGGALSQALGQTTRELEDVCEFSITGDVGSTFTQFLPAWYGWYGTYSERVGKVVSRCPQAGRLVSTVEAYEKCPQVVAVLTAASSGSSGSGSVMTTGTETGTGTVVPETSETSTTSTIDEPSAAHETGFLGAAGAVAAGLLGVAAIL